jgi:hypothetical protein
MVVWCTDLYVVLYINELRFGALGAFFNIYVTGITDVVSALCESI